MVGATPVISVDVGRKVAILTAEGQSEKEAPVVKGPRGFCTADFGLGPMDTEMPNLLFDAKPAEKQTKRVDNALKKRPSANAKMQSKRPKFPHSAAAIPAATETVDDGAKAAGKEDRPSHAYALC